MKNEVIAAVALLIVLVVGGVLIQSGYLDVFSDVPETAKNPEGIMFLIEYKDTIGLSNFVNEMKQRDVNGLLMVTPEFVQENCEDIKQIAGQENIEIVACNVDEPFWGVSYEEQKTRISSMLDGIEDCTGKRPRIISSRYFASDMNTIKAAEELGVPYVTGRGTTGTKASVYALEDYNVKILSVSNIELVTFKYGSMCDYSFFERAGTPEDMRGELDRSIEPLVAKEVARYGQYHRVTPVSHTNIGGYLNPWMNMWKSFWDETDVEWVDLDKFMENPDWTLPLWQVPINKNAPYTSEKIRPLVSYEDEEKVTNPCAVTDISSETEEYTDDPGYVGNKIVVFHNNKGSMCIEALDYLQTLDYTVEQHITTEEGFYDNLNSLKSVYDSSEGVSEDFGYYPIIFVKDKAYSGFNEDIQQSISEDISE